MQVALANLPGLQSGNSGSHDANEPLLKYSGCGCLVSSSAQPLTPPTRALFGQKATHRSEPQLHEERHMYALKFFIFHHSAPIMPDHR